MDKKCSKCNGTASKSVSVRHDLGNGNFIMISKAVPCGCKEIEEVAPKEYCYKTEKVES